MWTLRFRRGLSAVFLQAGTTESIVWVLRTKTLSGCREGLAGGWVPLELKFIPQDKAERPATQTARTKKGQSFL